MSASACSVDWIALNSSWLDDAPFTAGGPVLDILSAYRVQKGVKCIFSSSVHGPLAGAANVCGFYDTDSYCK